MSKVYINTSECEEMAKRLNAISGTISSIAANVGATMLKVRGVTGLIPSATSTGVISKASKKLKSASDCIYKAVELYKSADSRVAGFEDWLIDEELKEMKNGIKGIVEDMDSSYNQSLYRVIMDSYGVGGALMSFWDYGVDWDAEDVAGGAFGVDSEAEKIILDLCENEDASGIEQAYSKLIGLLSDGSGTIKDSISLIDDDDIKNEIIEYLNEHNVAAYDFDRLEDCLSIFNSALAAGEKDVAYFMLMNTVKFEALQPVIEATGDKNLIDTYSRMQYNLHHGLEMTAKTFGSELAFDTAMRGLGFVPGLDKVLKAKDATVMAMDYVFGTSESSDAYSMMKKCRSISDSVSVAVNKAKNEFFSSPTEENFDQMINAMIARAEMESLGNKYAYELYDAADNALIKNNVPAQLKESLEECEEVNRKHLETISQLASSKKTILEFFSRKNNMR